SILNSRPNCRRLIRHLRFHETPNLGVHETGSRPMPKFRFTNEEGGHVDRDDQSLEFPDARAATDDAQRALVDMASDKLPVDDGLDLSASVENDAGEEIYRASLKFRKEADRTPPPPDGAKGRK
ncbi:DUF6894 family protein, partial [Bosea sp. Root670]|uniref:DUF6894 family protein n=1 Tax=Bosea sp. Root670 TaxID=1736583 RepID=UPI001AED06C6